MLSRRQNHGSGRSVEFGRLLNFGLSRRTPINVNLDRSFIPPTTSLVTSHWQHTGNIALLSIPILPSIRVTSTYQLKGICKLKVY